MGCTSPLVRYTETGGITSLRKWLNRDINPQRAETKLKELLKADKIQLIPCGKCMDCRISQSRRWADRLEMECRYHENNWFLTLTYNDENVPHGYKVDKETGEITVENLTLVPKDVQDFLKRLRRNIEYHERGNAKKLMYFACGEYGEKTHRPHYHAIMYDLPIHANDLKELKRKNGFIYYTCEWLEKVWGKGNIILCGVEWECCAYVARYVCKKQKGKDAKEYYENLGVEPEFVRMSTKPAIGLQYYQDNKEDIYENDKIYLKKGKTCKPPRYFDKLRDAENLELDKLEKWGSDIETEAMSAKVQSEEMKELKRERRKTANDALFAQLKQKQMPLEQFYQQKETSVINRTKKLLRPDN